MLSTTWQIAFELINRKMEYCLTEELNVWAIIRDCALVTGLHETHVKARREQSSRKWKTYSEGEKMKDDREMTILFLIS